MFGFAERNPQSASLTAPFKRSQAACGRSGDPVGRDDSAHRPTEDDAILEDATPEDGARAGVVAPYYLSETYYYVLPLVS